MAKTGTQNSRREIMTAVELAEYLKISRHTVYQWINDCKIPFSYIKFDRAVRFDRRAVDQWLDSKTVESANHLARASAF